MQGKRSGGPHAYIYIQMHVVTYIYIYIHISANIAQCWVISECTKGLVCPIARAEKTT